MQLSPVVGCGRHHPSPSLLFPVVAAFRLPRSYNPKTLSPFLHPPPRLVPSATAIGCGLETAACYGLVATASDGTVDVFPPPGHSRSPRGCRRRRWVSYARDGWLRPVPWLPPDHPPSRHLDLFLGRPRPSWMVRNPINVFCFKNGEEQELPCNDNGMHFPSITPKQKSDDNDSCLSSTNSKSWISTTQQLVHRFFSSYEEPWAVPWTAETIIQVMVLWIASFWFVGSWIIPFLAHTAGFRKEVLTHRGQALYSLLTDMAEGLAGIAILHRCLARFRPLPSGWFNFSWKGNWKTDVLMGCLMFPLVSRLSQINLDLVPMVPVPPVGVSSVEQSIVARDPVAMALYAIVVSICAPVWEEIVFRGFLLPSLTKYMPLWLSILMSAVAFALAHFNIQRLLPLIFLGLVMGAVFARSRNLLASMLLHSLWNGFVFLDLMK